MLPEGSESLLFFKKNGRVMKSGWFFLKLHKIMNYREKFYLNKQNGSKKITYNCEQCSKSFTRRDSLIHHKKFCKKTTQEKM